MNIKTRAFIILFHLILTHFGRSQSIDELTALVSGTLGGESLPFTEQIARLDGLAAQYPDSDVGRCAAIVAAIGKIQTGASIEGIQKTFTQIATGRAGTWLAAFAELSLVNALHADGKHAEVVPLAEKLLNSESCNLFDTADDPCLAAVKTAIPLSASECRRLLAIELAEAYDRLGNSSKASQVRATYGISSGD